MSTRVAIDISPLSRDHRGMGFFVREFLEAARQAPHPSLEIALVSLEAAEGERFPYPLLKPAELDPSWLVWFPFNHPTFHPKGRYLVTLHDLAPFAFPAGQRKLQKKYEQGSRRAARVLVNSHFVYQEVRRYLGVEEKKAEVIPLGFNPQWPSADSFQAPWPYLLAVGPAEPRKNFERLLLAFARLKKKKFPHKLVMVGELPSWRKSVGPIILDKKNPLPQIARKAGVDHDILFPGPVSRLVLSRWYRGASLVAVPSLYEGFGFPVLEAYSCGVPLACSQASSLPEVAGEAAFYFNPLDVEEMASTLEHALTDRKAVQRKKEYAERQLSWFSWDRCLRRYFEVFERVGSTSPAG